MYLWSQHTYVINDYFNLMGVVSNYSVINKLGQIANYTVYKLPHDGVQILVICILLLAYKVYRTLEGYSCKKLLQDSKLIFIATLKYNIR